MKENYSTWVPKAQAAQQLGISERTLERFIAKGQVRRHYLHIPLMGRKPLPVCNPQDLEKLKASSVAPAPPTEEDETATEEHQESRELTLRSNLPPALRDFAAAFLSTLPYPPRSLFLSLKEAASYTGLSQACLLRMVKEGKLPTMRDRGYKAGGAT